MSQNSKSQATGPIETPRHLDCRICSNVLSGQKDVEPWDQVLFETNEFVCTPTVGAITDGYVLTIPKFHALSAGALNREVLMDYWNFTKSVVDNIEEKFGKSIIFEHGPAKPDTRVGCGVDHAHLHIVPIEGPIIEYASRINPTPIEWRSLNSITDLRELHNKDIEYLFFQDSDSDPLVGTSPFISSQLFRRAIAHILEIPQKYDWKEHSFEEVVQNTVTQIEQ